MRARAKAGLLALAMACLAACAPQPTPPTAPSQPPPTSTGDVATPSAPRSPTASPAAPVESDAPVPTGPTRPPDVTPPVPPRDDPQSSATLLTSCKADTDCEVKDVGSCCGYRPACVNRGARPDPAEVQARCAREGRVGICGFRDIQGCQCVSGQCEATPDANPAAGPLELR